MNAVATEAEIRLYLDAVKAHLADVDGRDELVGDLEGHLREVASEGGGGSLVEQLGPPQSYAAELVASAGLSSGSHGGAESVSLQTRVRRRLVAVRRHRRVVAALAFARELRPGWWIVRAYLAFLILATLFYPWRGPQAELSLPRFGGSIAVGVGLTLVLLLGSVWLGRHAADRRWTRWLSALISIGVFAVAVPPILVGPMSEPNYVRSGWLEHYDGNKITNLCAYDQDGVLLEDVLIFDQRGREVANPYPDFRRSALLEYGTSEELPPNSYPRGIVESDGTLIHDCRDSIALTSP